MSEKSPFSSNWIILLSIKKRVVIFRIKKMAEKVEMVIVHKEKNLISDSRFIAVTHMIYKLNYFVLR